jgi:hypothetical protein
MRSILIVALRVGAIILALQFFKDFPSLIFNYQEGRAGVADSNLFWLFQFLPSLLVLVISMIMWLFPDFLVKNLPFPQAEDDKFPFEATTFHFAAISVISLYILVNSAADIVYFVTLKLSLESQLGTLYQMQPETKAGLLSSVAGIIMGLFLLVKSKAIAKYLERILHEDSKG